ncbi:MAG: winged helix-turn-helix domain-containing protein, partial [Povalibacter sp.]
MERPAQIRFDGWVLSTDSGEMVKGDVRVRLQDKPLQILIELSARPGELVTREQLIARLWPKGVVDFDMALNAAMRRLRVALQDEADTPRYVETVPRKGYRFIAPIDPAVDHRPADLAPPAPEMAVIPTIPARLTIPWYQRVHMYAAGGLVALIVTGVTVISTRHQQTSSSQPQAAAAVRSPMHDDAQQLCERGERLLASVTQTDAEKAKAMFARASVLDPSLACSFVGAGQALLQTAAIRRDWATVCDEAGKDFDRALALDPGRGDAWIGRARCTQDPVMAEELFRQGLRLAPADGSGYSDFAMFLFSNRRRAEAMALIDQAMQSNLHSPPVLQIKAFFVMVTNNDLTEHNRLLRAALDINPHFYPALYQLAEFTYFFNGDFAESLQLIERAIAGDPQADDARSLAAMMYLDVDDPAAAMDVLRDASAAAEGKTILAQYQHDPVRAAEIAKSVAPEFWRWTHHSMSPLAEAVRDEGTITGDYAAAAKLLESVNSKWNWPPPMYRGFTPVYAHALVLAGETERGRKVASSLLAVFDAEDVGRPEHWFGRERSAALIVLGKPDQAIDELAGNQRLNHWVRWWYLS